MTWIGTLAFAAIGALLAKWVGKEAEGWIRILMRHLLGAATSRLPASRRSRLDEEWKACLADLPSPLSQLLFVVGIRLAAERIRAEDRRAGRCAPEAGPIIGGAGAAAGITAKTLALPIVTPRLKGLVWLSTCAAVAIGFYAVSARTAAARLEVASMEKSIARARLDIARLEHELASRRPAFSGHHPIQISSHTVLTP